MESWTEIKPQEYKASADRYNLNVRLSLFGGAVYIVKSAEQIIDKGEMSTVAAAMRRAEEVAAGLLSDKTILDVAP